jgi:pyrrolidone-carboxylate peptidase
MPIVSREVNHNDVFFWSEIDSARAIALHQFEPVDGTPLSHGCVRMNKPMAVRLFCGARQNQTIVHIRHLARPMCDHPALQKEWLNDFALAGTDPLPPDGDRTRASILTERMALESAFGRKLTPAETAAFTAADIPRCRIATVEEERSGRAGDKSEPEQILKGSGFGRRVAKFELDLAKVNGPRTADAAVRKHAGELWNAAVARAQGSAADTDDRPVYWARLRMLRALRLWVPPRNVGSDGQRDLLLLFERISRGMESTSFSTGAGEKKVLVTGFDPFFLTGAGIRRGNPSGAAVLSLDGRRLTNQGVTAEVQGVVFPVRFTDFNAGLVESVVGPHLTGTAPVDMVMTISQGRGTEFEAEQFAAGSRTTRAEDNLDLFGGKSNADFVVPPGASGPEFIETTLPVKEIRAELGRKQPLTEETEVKEIPAGSTQRVHRPKGPTGGSTSLEGSGGSYLSNEIFYRTSALRLSAGLKVPMGHLHTPVMQPSAVGVADPAYDRERDRIVGVVEKIVTATLPAL